MQEYGPAAPEVRTHLSFFTDQVLRPDRPAGAVPKSAAFLLVILLFDRQLMHGALRMVEELTCPGAELCLPAFREFAAEALQFSIVLGATLLGVKATGRPFPRSAFLLGGTERRAWLRVSPWAHRVCPGPRRRGPVWRLPHYRPGPSSQDGDHRCANSADRPHAGGGDRGTLVRGFPLQAAARGIGFWPAAALTSLAFGLSHVGNVGMTWRGVAMISMAGMAICPIRWLTGSLWFGIRSHLAWDYMELLVFATSGGSRLQDARTSGPDWLTGGGAGLESSAVGGGVELLLLFVPIALFWRRRPSATTRPAILPRSLNNDGNRKNR